MNISTLVARALCRAGQRAAEPSEEAPGWCDENTVVKVMCEYIISINIGKEFHPT